MPAAYDPILRHRVTVHQLLSMPSSFGVISAKADNYLVMMRPVVELYDSVHLENAFSMLVSSRIGESGQSNSPVEPPQVGRIRRC